jgi:hypothetical protein
MYAVYLLILLASLDVADSIFTCDAGFYKAPPALTDNICGGFAVHGGTAITFAVGNQVGSGNVGISPGIALTGTPTFPNGGGVVGDSTLFAASVVTNYAEMIRIKEDGHTIAAAIGGVTFIPGTYRSIGAITIAAGDKVTLDGLYESNPVFLFQSTTLSFGASSSVILKNGARPEHVLWVVTSSVVVGAGSVLRGSILSGTFIGFGAGTTMRGCLISQGAITLGAGVVTVFDAAVPESCWICPSGTTSPIGSTVVQNCSCMAGYKADSDGVVCSECQPGTFKSVLGVGTCSSCPTGTNSSDASTSIGDCFCTVGHTAETDGVECMECESGTFKPVSGVAACSNCPLGTFSRTGSTNIHECICRMGFKSNSSSGVECTFCEAGKFKDTIGAGISPPPIVVSPLTDEICRNFAIHAGVSVTFAVADIVDGGDVGVSPGTTLTGAAIFRNGAGIVNDSTRFAASVVTAHAAMMTSRENGHIIAVAIGGITFAPGTYRSIGAITMAASDIVILDGLNQKNPIFIFQSTTLSFGASASVVLINGARPEHVIWVTSSGISIAASCFIQGSILCGAAITIGAGTKLSGCALAKSTITLGATCTIHAPKIQVVQPPPSIGVCSVCPNSDTSILGRTSIEDCVSPTDTSLAEFVIGIEMPLIDFNSSIRHTFMRELAVTLNVSKSSIITKSVIQRSVRRRQLLTASIEVDTIIQVQSLETDSIIASATFDHINEGLLPSGIVVIYVSTPTVALVKPTRRRLITANEDFLLSGIGSCICVA